MAALTCLAAPLAFADAWQGWMIAVSVAALDARDRRQLCADTGTKCDADTAFLWFFSSNIFLVTSLYASMHATHWMVALPIQSGDPLEITGFLGMSGSFIGVSVAASYFLWAQAFARSEPTSR